TNLGVFQTRITTLMPPDQRERYIKVAADRLRQAWPRDLNTANHKQVADEYHPQQPKVPWRNNYCPWSRHMPARPNLILGVPVDGSSIDVLAPAELARFLRESLCGLAVGPKLLDAAPLPFNAAVPPAHSCGALAAELDHAANHGILRHPPGAKPFT